jgi:hypothetical protein
VIYKLTIGLVDYFNLKGVMSKKFSILEIVYFTYVSHTLVDKKHKKIVSIFWIAGSWGGRL